MEEVHKIALESVGRDRSDKDISDWANITWGNLASPRADCPRNRTKKTDQWRERLAQLDGRAIVSNTVRNVPRRRKRSENDSPDETRQTIRRKVDSLVIPPFSTRTNVHLRSVTSLQLPSPAKPPWEMISDDPLVWFAQPSISPCSSVAAWKKRVPRELRLHSLDALLLGSNSCGRLGVIVVDECDEHGEKWTRIIREKVVNRSIVVYGCKTGEVFGQEDIST